MLMLINKEFTFEAAHIIPNHYKCGVVHGHSWKLVVTVQGEVKDNGMVMDYHTLGNIVTINAIGDANQNRLLDHNDLSTILVVPTSENLIQWVWERLEKPIEEQGVKLYKLALYETQTNFCEYYG